MADETRRVPAFLSGPTAATAVLLPMRIYVGWFWLQLGLAKASAGWLAQGHQFIVEELRDIPTSNFIADALFSAARENVLLSQWLICGAQILFGALMIAGGVTRVAGVAIAAMSVIWWACANYPWASWPIPMALMALTLAVAAAGRYLGLDAILRSRLVRVPLF